MVMGSGDVETSGVGCRLKSEVVLTLLNDKDSVSGSECSEGVEAVLGFL